jgi:hypothetical protein
MTSRSRLKGKNWSSNRELSDALNDAYANDTDEEEKEFLRLAKINIKKIWQTSAIISVSTLIMVGRFSCGSS